MQRRRFLQLLSAASISLARPTLAESGASTSPDWFGRSRSFAALPMGRIAYVAKGRGPAALFLHGFPLNGYQWRGALENLSDIRYCIAPDLLGFGMTEVPELQPITPPAQVDMLDALLREMKVQKVDIVANDSGGIVAQLFVARFPHRVRSLLISNCDVDTNNPPPLFKPAVALAQKGLFADRYIAPQLSNKILARSAKGIGGQFTFPNSLADQTIEEYFAPLVSSDLRKRQLDHYTEALGQNVLTDVRDDLLRWRGPVRILWAMKDVFFPYESAEWLDQHFSGSKGIRKLEEAKLFFPEEMPDLISEEARQLWRPLNSKRM